ncbi:MAG TPA: diphthine--ammonia ligase [archaeon]|nr:diphthine--ammonia ligase [archaeon]
MLGMLFSGGKDSVFSLYYFLEQGWSVSCLISLKSKNNDSWMFHTPAINLVELQSKSLGIPLVLQETEGEKEKELDDLKVALARAKKEFGITGVAVGALLSDYQQERVNRICESLSLKCFAPLWHKDQTKLLKEIISLDFDVVLVGIASQGLGEDFLGKKIDEKMLESFVKLNEKYGFHVAGEGGEFESIVLDCPVFKKKIKLVETKKIMQNEFTGRLEILNAVLVDK